MIEYFTFFHINYFESSVHFTLKAHFKGLVVYIWLAATIVDNKDLTSTERKEGKTLL